MQKLDGKTPEGIHYQHWQKTNEKLRPVLTLIMGYSGSLASWASDFLEEVFVFADLILLDNRGTGYSFHPAQIDEITTEAMARDTDALFTHLGVNRSHVLGYSLGGCIAQHLAALYPDRVESLILLATTGGGRLYVPPAPGFLERLQTPEGENPWEMALSMWSLCASARALQDYREIFAAIHDRQMQKPTPRRTFAGQMMAFRNFRIQDLLQSHKLSFPVTIISGKGDRLMPHENSVKLQEFYQKSTLVEIDDCEHLPYIEQKQRLVTAIKGALSAPHL